MFRQFVPQGCNALASASRLAAPSRSVALPKRPLSTTSPAAAAKATKVMIEDDAGFGFARHNARPPKPRSTSVTEIRGPYYSAMGKRYLQDVFET